MARKTLDGLIRLGKIGLVAASALLPMQNTKADDKLQLIFRDVNNPTGGDNTTLRHSPLGDGEHIVPPVPTFMSYSLKSNIAYKVDSRPVSDESFYHVILTGDSGTGTNYFTPAGLIFNWPSPGSDSNRIYTAKVHLDSGFTSNGTPYDATFVIPKTGITTNTLPDAKINTPNTNSYVDISCRFITNAVPTSINMTSPLEIKAKAQPGTTIIPQYKESLTTGTWSNLDSYAQNVGVDSNSFNSNSYDSNAPSITFSNLPTFGKTNGFYRLRTLSP